MNLLALDLSLTSTGWAAKHGADPVASGTWGSRFKGVERLDDAVRWLDRHCDLWRPALVLVEGYSFGQGARGAVTRAHSTGEFGGVIRLRLHQRGITVVEVSPACRAKIATGKGNAPKSLVLVEAVKRLGFQGDSFDEADALWILQAALIRYGLPGAIRLPTAHLAALDGVDWPPAPLARAS